MKILNATVTLFLLTNFKCVKDGVEPQIVGKWRWVQSVGGIAGLTLKPSATDTRQMNFGADSKFELLMNNKVVSFATYKLTNGKSITSQESVPLIEFENDGFMKMSYQLKTDSLFLFDEVYDGFGSTYVRIK